MPNLGPVGSDAHEWGHCDEQCPHPAHLECEWSTPYTDFDGTRALAFCGTTAVVNIHWIEGTAKACLAHAPELRTEVARVSANMNWHRGYEGDL